MRLPILATALALLAIGLAEQGHGLSPAGAQKSLAAKSGPHPDCDQPGCKHAIAVSVGDALKTRMGAPFDSTPLVLEGPSGDRLAVWRASDGARYNLWANNAHGGVWGMARLIEKNPDDVGQPHLALDANGNGLAVWDQGEGTGHPVWAARYRNGKGWEAPQMISRRGTEAPRHAFNARVVLDDSGTAVVTWRQIDDKWFSRLWTNRFLPATGWDRPAPLEYQ